MRDAARRIDAIRMSYWSRAFPQRAHILVIDDKVEELQLLLAALRRAGHRISVAFEALEGYRRASALQPDLVLLDVHLGASSGFEACRLLKADRGTARIPVIFLSASHALEERLTGLREGGVDYILKPFEPEEVLLRVAVHLALARGDEEEQPPQHPDARSGTRGTAALPHDADRVLVEAAVRLIENDLAHVPPLAELAARVGTHEKRLSRAFRAHMRRTVFEFVREARLARAQRLLTDSALSVEEVALAVGFSGAANFSTAFRERFGSTPGGFRRMRGGCAQGARCDV
ncbi:DNA-binding response OmpR family regulator [Variovorax sp. TBS-050B]|uniref:DNA-binding response regulator n=1 Tax=Variovorax sp. TBS-050B TaxID=2940551 RepID=UPI002476036A|nr:DNA-binding response regulator [Variovorax sp. TBS-050B]MDH6590524.1 DNA-binding response OmpR family regulator [Variovorax sp. TBS-050B]